MSDKKIPVVKWSIFFIIQFVWLFIIGPICVSATDSFLVGGWVIITIIVESIIVERFINKKRG